MADLEGQPEGLVCGPGRGVDGVNGVQKSHAADLDVLLVDLPLDGPSLVPGHVGRSLKHVVSSPSRDGDEGDGGGVVPDLLDETLHLLLDLIEPKSSV